jgi:hypothetical protein
LEGGISLFWACSGACSLSSVPSGSSLIPPPVPVD